MNDRTGWTRWIAGRLWAVPVAVLTLAAAVGAGADDVRGGTGTPERTGIVPRQPAASRTAPARAPAVDASAPAGAWSPPATLDLVRVRWSPERPVQGTVFTVRVRPDGPALERVEATFAGEPLHFRRSDDGEFAALAAVPVDAEGERTLRIEATTAAAAREASTARVPIAPGDYRMEELSVAPRYGGDYDAETRARISREYRRAVGVAADSHDTPRMWEPPFLRPRPSRITSGFGNGRVFNGELQSRHTGTDFAGDVGAPVVAPARGVARIVDSFYLGGNVVYIDHGAGLVTGYLHLSEATVAQGDTVEAGQVIGRVGATGRVTGPHLHWIVRYGEISVNGLSLQGIRDAADGA